jgi:hypothetical protein
MFCTVGTKDGDSRLSTLINFYETKWSHIPEGSVFHSATTARNWISHAIICHKGSAVNFNRAFNSDECNELGPEFLKPILE